MFPRVVSFLGGDSSARPRLLQAMYVLHVMLMAILPRLDPGVLSQHPKLVSTVDFTLFVVVEAFPVRGSGPRWTHARR